MKGTDTQYMAILPLFRAIAHLVAVQHLEDVLSTRSQPLTWLPRSRLLCFRSKVWTLKQVLLARGKRLEDSAVRVRWMTAVVGVAFLHNSRLHTNRF
jgi:hypothetical protein